MSIDERCSVFTGELLAVKKALGFIIDNNWKKDVLILSDNQSVIKNIVSLKLNYSKSKITCEIRERILRYLSTIKNSQSRVGKVVIGGCSPTRA